MNVKEIELKNISGASIEIDIGNIKPQKIKQITARNKNIISGSLILSAFEYYGAYQTITKLALNINGYPWYVVDVTYSGTSMYLTNTGNYLYLLNNYTLYIIYEK